jgi:hypothetical protein
MKNYLEQAKNKLHELEQDIAARTNGTVSGLREKQRAARERLSALESSNKERWDILKHGFEDAWQELRAAYDAVREDVKGEQEEDENEREQSAHP